MDGWCGGVWNLKGARQFPMYLYRQKIVQFKSLMLVLLELRV